MTDSDLEDARDQIVGRLPAAVRWMVDETPFDTDFSRARTRLWPIQESEVLCGLRKKWLDLHLFAEQNYAEGGGAQPFLGISRSSGKVMGLDVEREASQLYLLNSDIECFIRTFELFDACLRQHTIPLSNLASEASAIDPVAFRRSDWRVFADYLVSL